MEIYLMVVVTILATFALALVFALIGYSIYHTQTAMRVIPHKHKWSLYGDWGGVKDGNIPHHFECLVCGKSKTIYLSIDEIHDCHSNRCKRNNILSNHGIIGIVDF